MSYRSANQLGWDLCKRMWLTKARLQKNVCSFKRLYEADLSDPPNCRIFQYKRCSSSRYSDGGTDRKTKRNSNKRYNKLTETVQAKEHIRECPNLCKLGHPQLLSCRGANTHNKLAAVQTCVQLPVEDNCECLTHHCVTMPSSQD